jgi:predicted chitinase
VSVEAAFRAGGVATATAKAEAPRAERAMVERGITTQHEAAAFIAQVLHESVRLAYFEEIASGAAYEGRVDLGNTQPGDGRRFKGRGPIQLTGRANYRWAGGRLGLPLEQHPELAAGHEVGWRIAALYWQSHGLDAFADGTQAGFDTITRRINGGLNGKASRDSLWREVRRVDCRPVDPWAGFTASELRWIHEYDHLKATGQDVDRRRVLRRTMGEQRKRVWRAAQPPGSWEHANRRARWRALNARSG